jgi:hypothetical protein
MAIGYFSFLLAYLLCSAVDASWCTDVVSIKFREFALAQLLKRHLKIEIKFINI